jgi:tetratricopeptide (TPR) repeat protein
MLRLIYTLTLVLLTTIAALAQEETTKEVKLSDLKIDFKKSTADGICKCIDSIDSGSKSRDSINSEIKACIDDKVMAYQMIVRLSAAQKEAEASGEKSTNVEINTNKESQTYKKYFYELQEYLMDNCPALKTKLATNDRTSDYSLSKNEEAMKFYRKGLEETQKGDFEAAILNYKKAVVYDSNFAFAYDNMGICYRRLNQYDAAIEAYEKSLKIDPNGTMPLQNIAIAYGYKGEFKKAIKAYERLAKITPNNPEVFYGIGLIYHSNLNDQEKALDNMCQALILYSEQNSAYRTDAERVISMIYKAMKDANQLEQFNAILKKHKIGVNE